MKFLVSKFNKKILPKRFCREHVVKLKGLYTFRKILHRFIVSVPYLKSHIAVKKQYTMRHLFFKEFLECSE